MEDKKVLKTNQKTSAEKNRSTVANKTASNAASKSNVKSGEAGRFQANRNRSRNPRNRRRNLQKPKSQFEEVVIKISRVTKVVKGGRRFSFSAFVVVGNRKGKVGFGHGKANEVPDAIKKAVKIAVKNAIEVVIFDDRTLPHELTEKFLASKVLLKPAPKGRGLIAASSVRTVVELAGYKDIYSKVFGSRTKQNVVRATINLLQKLRRPEDIAASRNKTVSEILGRSV